MEDSRLNNISFRQFQEGLPASKCLSMDESICLTDIRYEDNSDVFKYPCRIDAYVAVFCLSGHVRISVNLNEFEMTERSMFLCMPGNILKASRMDDTPLEKLHYICVVLSRDFVYSMRVDVHKMFSEGVSMLDNPCMKLTDEEFSIATDYLSLIAKEMSSSLCFRKDGISSLISSLFYLMVGIHTRCSQESDAQILRLSSRNRQIFDQFIKLIVEYHTKYRNVGFYADKLCLTPKYLSKLIKNITGRSAPEWIDAYVLLEAKNMLKYSTATIKEIVYGLNFPNQSVFYKFFKARTGMTPSEYRNS